MKPKRTPRQKSRRERTERATQCCGRFLQRLRNKSGLTRSDVGRRLGQSASYLLRMETGKRRIGVVEFMDYLAVLGKSPSDAMRELLGEFPALLDWCQEEGKPEVSR